MKCCCGKRALEDDMPVVINDYQHEPPDARGRNFCGPRIHHDLRDATEARDRAERQAEALAKALEEGLTLIQKPDPFMRDEVDDWAQRAAAIVAAYREGR